MITFCVVAPYDSFSLFCQRVPKAAKTDPKTHSARAFQAKLGTDSSAAAPGGRSANNPGSDDESDYSGIEYEEEGGEGAAGGSGGGLSEADREVLAGMQKDIAKRVQKLMKKRQREDDDSGDDAGDSKKKPKSTEEKRSKKRKRKRISRQERAQRKRGVMYVGHLPYGFYEEEMHAFFSQFGTVTRVRVSRNKKTKKPKGYAFVEFLVSEVADTVAEAMNGYMMFSRTLVAKRLQPSEVHRNTFLGCHKPLAKATRPIDRRKGEMRKRQKPKTEEQHEKRLKKLVTGETRLRAKLKAAGVEYDFDGYAEQLEAREGVAKKKKKTAKRTKKSRK